MLRRVQRGYLNIYTSVEFFVSNSAVWSHFSCIDLKWEDGQCRKVERLLWTQRVQQSQKISAKRDFNHNSWNCPIKTLRNWRRKTKRKNETPSLITVWLSRSKNCSCHYNYSLIYSDLSLEGTTAKMLWLQTTKIR